MKTATVMLLYLNFLILFQYFKHTSSTESNSFCAGTNSSNEKTEMNCSGLNITSLPESIPVSIHRLTLSNNLLRKILPGTFQRLIYLVYLDLSNNLLHKLDATCFKGLRKLKVLNISSNKLITKDSFATGVFNSLVSLVELDMRYNFIDTKLAMKGYPDEALGDLTSLEVLKIDCIRGKVQVCSLFKWF